MKNKISYSGIELMANAPVGTAIIRLALPMMIAMLGQAIFSITDIFFIGQVDNHNMLAAVSLAFPLYMLSQAIGNIFATGGSTYISRMLGMKENKEALYASSVSFYTSFGIGILTSVILWVFKEPLLWQIGASEATFMFTDDYLSPILLSMPLAVVSVVMSGILRSEGETKKAMILQLIGIIMNIILDYIFIIRLELGTAGAGWATVGGQCTSFIYGIHYFLLKKSILSIKFADYKPNKVMMFQMLTIGIPAGLSNIIMSISNILVNRIAASYGDFVVAGYGVQLRISGILFLLVFAIVMGFQPFAGFNYGAKQFVRLREGFKLTIIYSTAVCIIGFLVLLFFGTDIIKIFVNDMETVEAGSAIMHAFVWGIPFMGVQVTLMASFQALGKPFQAMIISMGRQLLFYIPLLYMLNHFFGFIGFIWAQPIADILTTGIAVVLGISLIKIMKIL